MFTIWLTGIVLGLGMASVLVLAYARRDQRPILLLLAVVLGAANIGLGFAGYPFAKSQTKLQAVGGYHQTLNGSFTDPRRDVKRCEQGRYGSNCTYTFPCDSYQERIDDSWTDSKGNRHVAYHYETRWETCPVATLEINYSLVDNFGNVYMLAENVFDQNPQQYRSGDGEMQPIPPGVPRNPPARWTQVRDLIKAGNAPSVAVDDVYTNVILGAEAKSFIEHSDDVPALKEKNLLPPYTVNLKENYGIHDGYLADKMQFVCMKQPANYAAWQDRLMHANAAIGMTAQGDLHIVAIPTSCLPKGISPDAYMSALKAFWQSGADFGKLALPKNAIIVAIGVDDSRKKIEWVRAKTGMPETVNGPMLNLLMLRFEGRHFSFSPDVVLGDIRATITRDPKKDKLVPKYSLDDAGIMPRIILQEEPFVRMCMLHCDAPKEKGMHSFVRLQDLIPVSTKWVIITMLLQVVAAAILLALMMYTYYRRTGVLPRYRLKNPLNRSRHYRSSHFGY